MVGVVVTGHGGFAAGMAANVKMLAGSDAELKAVDFADGMDVEVFEKQLAEAIDSYADCEAVLVLADIAGGTPYNRAAGLSMGRVMDIPAARTSGVPPAMSASPRTASPSA